MRILHVIPGLTHERGGPTTCVGALARHQVAAGHQVHVIHTDQGARHGESLVDLPAGATSESAAVWGPDRLAYAPGFATLVRRGLQNADIVHVHSIFTYPVHVALREASAAKVPAILRPCGHLHRFSLQRSRWLKTLYLNVWGDVVRRGCACWHYTSKQEAAESWPGPNAAHFVLPNGIEPNEYAINRADARNRVGETWPQIGQAPYVLFLGRLHPKKRLDVLLTAFANGAPSRFKLVVAGPDECNLWQTLAEQFLKRRDVAARVIRLGTVTGQDKIALLAAATLFALPSEHENFGIAALEALASGTPVLLSPNVDFAPPTGFEEWCRRARVDGSEWCKSLAEFLDASPRCAASVDSLRQAIWTQYSWRSIAAELTSRYGAVLGGSVERAGEVSVRPLSPATTR